MNKQKGRRVDGTLNSPTPWMPLSKRLTQRWDELLANYQADCPDFTPRAWSIFGISTNAWPRSIFPGREHV